MSRESLLIPPLNFAMVQKGVYRSGFPNNRNFGFLKQLGIRTIVCLAGELVSCAERARARVARWL